MNEVLGQQGPSCLLGECLNLSVKGSGSWLLSLPPGTFPNCISQQEGGRAISLLVPSQAFPVEEYSSVATSPCTQTSQAEEEKRRSPSALTTGLHWEKKKTKTKGMAAALPQLCEKRDQTAQARLGDMNKRRADGRSSPSWTSGGANLLSLVMLEHLLAA